MNDFVAGASNPNDCVQAVAPVPVASCRVRLNDTAAIRKKEKCVDTSPRRRSNRDINSIRLAGVGKTAHTFYRRMRTLFFSNPSQEECQTLFLNGSRRRKKKNKMNASCADSNHLVPTTESSSSKENNAGDTTAVSATVVSATMRSSTKQKALRVERCTNPEEPAIYIIDNFLTNSELEYFDQKIASISFEKSFVDKLGSEDDEEEDDKNDDNIESKNAQHGIVCKDQNQDGIATKGKTQNVSSICDDDSSISKGTVIDTTKENKKSGHKRKKRKRKTIIDDSHRTSTFYSFRKLHDTKITALEQRIASILGCWVHQIEALQLVRYVPGQFFGIHHDLGNLLEDDSVQLPPKKLGCKRRLVTIFCYLNTLRDGEGGCTYFPKCGHLRVKPKRGRAVLWCNITPDGKADPRTIHAGEAVKSNSAEAAIKSSCTNTINDERKECQPGGSRKKIIESKVKRKVETKKYGLNIWVCEE